MAALSALRTDLYARLNDPNNRIVSAAQANSLLNQAAREWALEEAKAGELAQHRDARRHRQPAQAGPVRERGGDGGQDRLAARARRLPSADRATSRRGAGRAPRCCNNCGKS